MEKENGGSLESCDVDDAAMTDLQSSLRRRVLKPANERKRKIEENDVVLSTENRKV